MREVSSKYNGIFHESFLDRKTDSQHLVLSMKQSGGLQDLERMRVLAILRERTAFMARTRGCNENYT